MSPAICFTSQSEPRWAELERVKEMNKLIEEGKQTRLGQFEVEDGGERGFYNLGWLDGRSLGTVHQEIDC
jgi:hypothetical protein